MKECKPLLGGYARNGDWDGAARVLSELQRVNLRPDSYTFTHLVGRCRLTLSKTVLKAPLVSVLEATI